MVLAAFRRIPLPSLRSHSQPANKTLINFDTIFFTDAEPLTRNLTLLGQRVRLEIKPSRFEWVHGDGTTATTATPGSPYPAKDVVYRYADAHRTVQHRVVVTWSAEWSLNGGPLQPVNGTVTTSGPATPLRVAEASPALSGERSLDARFRSCGAHRPPPSSSSRYVGLAAVDTWLSGHRRQGGAPGALRDQATADADPGGLAGDQPEGRGLAAAHQHAGGPGRRLGRRRRAARRGDQAVPGRGRVVRRSDTWRT